MTRLPLIGWTEADQAELDVLLHELTAGYWEHRKTCAACSPEPCPYYEAWQEHRDTCPHCIAWDDAPLSHKRQPVCLELREAWLEHNRRGCAKCLPCPHLQAAIRETVDWFEARRLLSRAQALRAKQEAA